MPIVSSNGLLTQSVASPLSGTTQLISHRDYGDVASPLLFTFSISHAAVSGSGVNTLEKQNTRSAESAFYDGTLGGTSPKILVLLSGKMTSHLGWVAHPRYFPVLIDTDFTQTTIRQGGASNFPTFVTAWAESTAPLYRRLRRRSTKPGYWPRLGNDSITNHQKTGSGAYQFFGPHFSNDTALVDTSAWRNGSTQADARDGNVLAALVLRTRTLMGTGL